ncbi:hypothetical protein Ddye_000501 [Dipteronia dyeriana]|uniref:Zinc finger PMZ-type domain-containing protein n=1 Tax=Dipteronia dyeriana TaxID=168575 RepID=A0AAD9XM70_9ROSI|nr:hypothetical protein Ddye_000501 [Dipteronia dyeriana]
MMYRVKKDNDGQHKYDPHDPDQFFCFRVHHDGEFNGDMDEYIGGGALSFCEYVHATVSKEAGKKDKRKHVLEKAGDQEAEGQGQGQDDIAAETYMDPTKIWDSLNVPNRPHKELGASRSEFEDVSDELCSLEGWSDGEEGSDMYPVAYTLVEAETKDTLGWFLDQLTLDLDLNNSFGIVWNNDKQKGLIVAIVERFQNLEHRFNQWMEKMKTESLPTYNWLAGKDAKHSSRQANNRYDEADQKLPNEKTSKEKAKVEKWSRKIGPKVFRFVEKVKQESVYYYSEYNGNSTYQVRVRGDEQFFVDINDRTCVCNKWQLIEIPYVHGMTTLLSTNQNPMDFIHLRCIKYGKEGHNRVTCERMGGGSDSVRGSQADEGGSESIGGSQADEGSQSVSGL